MGGRVRSGGSIRSAGIVAVLVIAAIAAVGAGSAFARVPAISKDDYLTKANAICAAGTAKIDAAGAKLGDSPSAAAIKAFVVKTLVPNVTSQIAAIRKLGYPPGDKAQLSAIFTAGEAVLAKIVKNPQLATGSTDPFAAVNEKLSAYGLHSCAGDDPVSVAENYAGTYQGTWTNTTFGSTGTVTIKVAVDATAKTMTITTTLTGNVFGAPAPAPETVTVSLGTAEAGQPVTLTSPLFGQLTISVKSDGTLVGDAPDVPGTAINTFHVELKPSDTGFAGTYTVGLASGTTANGTLTLAKS